MRRSVRLACQPVPDNKGAAGVDGIGIAEFKAHLKRHRPKIKATLRAREGMLQPIRRLDIAKRQGGIPTLGVPTRTDGLIEQGLLPIRLPVLEDGFSET